MSRRNRIISAAIVALAVALPVGCQLLPPLFINRMVHEELQFIHAETTAGMQDAIAETEKKLEEPITEGERAGMRILARVNQRIDSKPKPEAV